MTNYNDLNKILDSYFLGIEDEITILSNLSALLNEYIDDISWVGFYLLKNDHLILGPFQGLIACMTIENGKGVCGTCLKEGKTIIVKNVHEFKGHIACDSRSNSEIVVPIFIKNKFYGLIDIDSTSFERFNEEDQTELEKISNKISKILEKVID